MLTIKTYIAPDQYGGRGVFAAQAVKKGDVVWRFTESSTRIMTVDEYMALMASDEKLAHTLQTYCYPAELDHEGVFQRVLCHDLDNGSFMNHDDNPNTGIITDHAHPLFDESVNIALRDIAEGEELTYDYYDFIPDLSQWMDIPMCMQFLVDAGRLTRPALKKAS